MYTLMTFMFLWELRTNTPFGLIKFVLPNRESHSNQTSSGKFLRRYKGPLIHGNALGLWCVCIQRLSLLIIGSYETD